MAIRIKNKQEIQKMKAAGRIVAETHLLLADHLKVGMTTWELDQLAEKHIKSQKAYPSFKGYNGFPGSICASVNSEVVHGIPSKEGVLQEGDLISIDIGAQLDGYHGDAARSYVVGSGNDQAQKLIEATQASFYKGLELVKPGNHLYAISSAIQTYAEGQGYSIVRELVGHGIGTDLHEEPQVPNYKPIGRGPKLQVGMALAIEPMVNQGRKEIRVLDDDWTVVAADGSLSAHYENTIIVTDSGYDILTLI